MGGYFVPSVLGEPAMRTRILWGIVAGVASALIGELLGVHTTFGRAVTFAVVFVVVFGGVAMWQSKSPAAPPSTGN
jgi:hypothetical protein